MWIYVHTKVTHSEKKETNIRGNGLGPSKNVQTKPMSTPK